MLRLQHAQIEAAQRPSDAAAIIRLADDIAATVEKMAPDMPAVLVRLNLRMLLASLGRHGVEGLGAQSELARRFFAAGTAMVRDPHSSRWRHALASRDMTPAAKLCQLDRVLKDAEAAIVT